MGVSSPHTPLRTRRTLKMEQVVCSSPSAALKMTFSSISGQLFRLCQRIAFIHRRVLMETVLMSGKVSRRLDMLRACPQCQCCIRRNPSTTPCHLTRMYGTTRLWQVIGIEVIVEALVTITTGHGVATHAVNVLPVALWTVLFAHREYLSLSFKSMNVSSNVVFSCTMLNTPVRIVRPRQYPHQCPRQPPRRQLLHQQPPR